MESDYRRDATLTNKFVGQVQGHFLVPHYQRGYRWGPVEVERLLDDVQANGSAPYFLQPVVVKKLPNDRWELIDGQQRLTTLFLILQYIQRNALPSAHPPYTLEYETRASSQAYLSDLTVDDSQKNIDFFHIYQAYESIRGWFERQDNSIQSAIDFFTATSKALQVIWYQAPDHMDSKELFRRLNVGRIPLTDAELVKALLLARFRDEDGNQEHAHQVATQWDVIERDLRNPELWAFATKRSSDEPSYINLLLDALADDMQSPSVIGSRPSFHTFETLRPAIEKSPKKVWEDVQDLHSRLLGWYDDRDLYHWIGYLTAAGERFGSLVTLADGLTRTQFADALKTRISNRLNLSSTQLAELTYQSKAKCTDALLLMNVEAVRQRTGSSERYSFKEHSSARWSLEHIHAQNAEDLRTAEQWKDWLTRHREAFASLPPEDGIDRATLMVDIEHALVSNTLSETTFRRLEERVVRAFSTELDDAEDVHSITNLALLSNGDNSALSNSVFEVKRREIIRRDKAGSYIPACTRDAFLKYFTDKGPQQFHFWGPQDRDGYLKAMENLLNQFLTKSGAA